MPEEGAPTQVTGSYTLVHSSVGCDNMLAAGRGAVTLVASLVGTRVSSLNTRKGVCVCDRIVVTVSSDDSRLG